MRKIIFGKKIKFAPEDQVAKVENNIITMHSGFQLQEVNCESVFMQESRVKAKAGNRVKQELKLITNDPEPLIPYLDEIPLIIELPTESRGTRVFGSLDLPAVVTDFKGNAPDTSISVERLAQRMEFQV